MGRNGNLVSNSWFLTMRDSMKCLDLLVGGSGPVLCLLIRWWLRKIVLYYMISTMIVIWANTNNMTTHCLTFIAQKGHYILELEYCQNTYKHEKENKHYISCRILLPRGQTTHLFWIGLPVFAITLRLSTINNVYYQNRITNYGHTSQLFTGRPIQNKWVLCPL